MQNQTDNTTVFDPEKMISDMLDEMGMQEASLKEREELAESLREQMSIVIMDAMANHLEPEIMKAVMEHYTTENNMDFILSQLLTESPSAQIAVVNGMNELRQQLLEAFDQLK